VEAKPDPYTKLKEAHVAGKVIQRNIHSGMGTVDPKWQDQAKPDWTWPVETYRIKPEAPPFTLPTPPPGKEWHRKDGWTAEMLPPGTRPLVEGEIVQYGDFTPYLRDGKWQYVAASIGKVASANDQLFRTTRPLTFEHSGKLWSWHRPGDKMPCDGDRKVEVLFSDNTQSDRAYYGSSWSWRDTGDDDDILGWRYADTPTVPLGPEDVTPGSVFRHKDWLPGVHRAYMEANETGVNWDKDLCLDWCALKDSYWQINRSIPLTGLWNPDAWEHCHKPT